MVKRRCRELDVVMVIVGHGVGNVGVCQLSLHTFFAIKVAGARGEVRVSATPATLSVQHAGVLKSARARKI